MDLLSAVRVTLLGCLERVRTGKCKFTRVGGCNLPPSKAGDSADNWIVTASRDIVRPDGRCRKVSPLRASSPCSSGLCRPLPLPSGSSGLEQELAAAHVRIGSTNQICRQKQFVSRGGGEEFLLVWGRLNCCAWGGTDAGVKRSLLL